jgi:uncharacterized SAM-binding protein YcdF (DUF218 family)
MFFILSKTMYYLLMPVMWVVILLLIAVFTKKQGRRKSALVASLILLLFFTNQVISNEAMKAWEIPAVPFAELAEHDVAVVLTGVTNVNKEPTDRVHFQFGADRVMHTVQLYKIGKVKKILISGGGGASTGERFNEAEEMQKVFLLCGVPQEDIIIETASLNTRDNAVNSARLLNEYFPGQKYLLVTSAFHMRRAEACFQKVGVEVTPFTTAFYSSNRNYGIEEWIAPAEDGLLNWGIIFHEVLGIVIYKLMGYI